MSRILVFNTDGTVNPLTLTTKYPVKKLDFLNDKIKHNIREDDTTLHQNSINNIHRLIKENISTFTVSFFGSGDFHHFTLFMLQHLKNPFYLVMFDNHYDVGSFKFKHKANLDYDMGSWMYSALWFKHCKGVLLVGPDNDGWLLRKIQSIKYLKENFNLHVVEADDKDPVFTYSEYIKSIPSGCDIYITIDKDVLAAQEVATDWGNGLLTINNMFIMLSMLIQKFGKQIIGVDVCGDPRKVDNYSKQRLDRIREQDLDFNKNIIKLFNNYIRFQ
jgi:arginase family enzyme